MEIYADVIFFVNFIFSYVLLYILGKFVNTVKIKKLRLAVAAVIGGIGSIPGAMVGGVLLGLIEKIAQSIPAIEQYTTAIEFGLLIVILLVKPTGILGKQRNEKV